MKMKCFISLAVLLWIAGLIATLRIGAGHFAAEAEAEERSEQVQQHPHFLHDAHALGHLERIMKDLDQFKAAEAFYKRNREDGYSVNESYEAAFMAYDDWTADPCRPRVRQPLKLKP